MVDQAKLDQMLSNLRRYVGVLKDLGTVPRDMFLSNGDRVGNAKYHFVIAIECCIDIANHIISSENYRFPLDNADSFVVLVEHGVIPPEHEESLRAMAAFRNRLVHMYWDVDDRRIYGYLKDSVSDIEHFAQVIARRNW